MQGILLKYSTSPGPDQYAQLQPNPIPGHLFQDDYLLVLMTLLKLHRHDLRVPVVSLSRLKLSLPQCNVPGVLNCMSGRLSGFPSLY